ncbi:MAG: polyprenyl synthetase family protein [Chitinophagales bacterium]
MHSAEELQQLFNNELKKLSFSRQPNNLYDPFKYMLDLGGKRMRPVMLLMACEMFGADGTKAISQAIALELFHNFTLIHDDIMDRAPLRRGKPSVHQKYGSATAILSGDAMLIYAYQYLIKTSFSPIEKLVSVFNDCAISICEGQQMDMNFEKGDTVSVEQYFEMIDLKTATLLAASMRVGAMIGGASEQDAEHTEHFGKNLGVAFQLKDDWLDAFGEAGKTGKQRGGDIIQNKKTFLLLEALRRADDDTKTELNQYFMSSGNDPEKKVGRVLEIFNSLQLDLVTRQAIEEYFSKALLSLQKIEVGQELKLPLKNLIEIMMQRDH